MLQGSIQEQALHPKLRQRHREQMKQDPRGPNNVASNIDRLISERNHQEMKQKTPTFTQ